MREVAELPFSMKGVKAEWSESGRVNNEWGLLNARGVLLLTGLKNLGLLSLGSVQFSPQQTLLGFLK